MDIKINYTSAENRANKKMAYYYAIAGLILLILDLIFNVSSLSIESFFSPKNTPLMFIVLALAMYLTMLFQIKNGYATLNEDKITRNTIIKKSINLNEVDTIRKFAGDYNFKKGNKVVFRINTQRCNPDDIKLLDKKIDDIGILWT